MSWRLSGNDVVIGEGIGRERPHVALLSTSLLPLPIGYALWSDNGNIGGILNAATRMIDPPRNVNFALKTRIRGGHFLVVRNTAITVEEITCSVAIRDE